MPRFTRRKEEKSPETASCPSANAPAQFDLIVAHLEPEKLLRGTVNNHPRSPVMKSQLDQSI